MMAYWREASTLILALRMAGNTKKLASSLSRVVDYKILMLKRSARSSFMPSKLVFPGGMCHSSDFSGDWNGVYEKVLGHPVSLVSSNKAASYPRILPGNWTLPPDIAYRISAIRETFEESGLLLATNQDLSSAGGPVTVSSTASELMKAEEYRQTVEQKPDHFMQMCLDLGVVPNIWALSDWRNWLTPVFRRFSEPPAKPRRFNTMFYMCCIDCDTVPRVYADEGETTQPELKTASAFIEDDMNRDPSRPPLAPPQVYEMHGLRQLDSIDDIQVECWRRQQSGIQCWMPVYRFCRDAALVMLPGDYMYPAEPDYEGTREPLGPVNALLADLNDQSRSLNRILFGNPQTFSSLKQADTTVEDTAVVDSLLQKGTILCNI